MNQMGSSNQADDPHHVITSGEIDAFGGGFGEVLDLQQTWLWNSQHDDLLNNSYDEFSWR